MVNVKVSFENIAGWCIDMSGSLIMTCLFQQLLDGCVSSIVYEIHKIMLFGTCHLLVPIFAHSHLCLLRREVD